jgi:hypothetical protein
MIGRRAITVLAFLCALVFSLFASQSAFAEIPETTAFECTKSAATRDFSDAHCDITTTPQSNFGHTKLSNTVETAVTATNEKTANMTLSSTPATLEGEAAGMKVKITCTKLSGSGKLINEEPSAGVMRVKGTGSGEATDCTVEKPLKCTVAEPIVGGGSAVSLTNLGAGKNEMGAESSPPAGQKVYAVIEFLNKGAEVCAFNKSKFNIEGSGVGTSPIGSDEATKESGATAVSGPPDGNFTFAGKPATLRGVGTASVTATGNAVVLTTPPYHT